MGNFFKMLVIVIGGTVVLTIFAVLYFALAFTVLSAMGGAEGDPYSLGQKVGATAAIAGVCAGLLISMGIAGDKLKSGGDKGTTPVIVIGWVLVLPVVVLFAFGSFGAAFDAVMQYKTLGVFAVILYGAIVGWAVRKYTHTR